MTCVVLLVAAGADWEPAALTVLERAPGVVVLKRCVDVDDLLAAAASGQAEAAVVDAGLPGLDAAVTDQLRHLGVRTVAVLPAGPAGEPLRARAARAGLAGTVGEDALDRLPAAVRPVAGAAGSPPAARAPGGPPAGSAAGLGRVVAVWGPAGAPGRTTVAVAIAAELARRRLRTVLADVDPAGGAVAPLLGLLDEVSGLLAAGRLAHAGELASSLPAVLRSLGPHLDVLTGLPRPERWAELRPGLVADVAACGRAGGHVVLDTGASLEDDGGSVPGRGCRQQLTLDALEAADTLVVVGAPDPVGLSRLARGLADLRERTGLVPHVVVNRMRPGLSWREGEVTGLLSGAGLATDGGRLLFLPDDPATVDRAAVTGRTLLETAPDAALPRAVAALVDAFAPPPMGVRARHADRGDGSDREHRDERRGRARRPFRRR